MGTVADEVIGLARVRRGRLFIEDRHLFDTRISQLREEWQLEVTVKRLSATRSLRANNFYWSAVIGAISEQTGYHPDETHDLMKILHLPKSLSVCDGNGEVVGEYVMGGSTRKLTVSEFYAYVERVRQWAAETMDLVIPDPHGPPDFQQAQSWLEQYVPGARVTAIHQVGL